VSDGSGKPFSQGSGFFVDADGVLVTNYHVIRGGSKASVEIPGHQVRTAQIDLDIPAINESVDAGMLQESSNDAADMDRFALIPQPRPQATDSAHEEVYGKAGTGSRIKLVNDGGVGESVRLRKDSCRPSSAKMGDLPVNQLYES